MNPWKIIAEEEKSFAEGLRRLILLRSPHPMDPYKVYGLVKRAGSWLVVDRFQVPGTTGTEAPDWAFRQAWPQFLAHKGKEHGLGVLMHKS